MLTQTDFDKFTQYVEQFSKQLAPDWGVFTEFGVCRDNQNIAHVHWDLDNRAATITLNKKQNNLTDKELYLTAFHEVVHLTTASIVHFMEKFYSSSFVDEIEHTLIRRLETFAESLYKTGGANGLVLS